jgi:putative FmdB family regulatory protein
MPLYEFVCTDCAEHTDVFASLAEKEAGLEVTCHACGSDRTRRACRRSRSADGPARLPRRPRPPRPRRRMRRRVCLWTRIAPR